MSDVGESGIRNSVEVLGSGRAVVIAVKSCHWMIWVNTKVLVPQPMRPLSSQRLADAVMKK